MPSKERRHDLQTSDSAGSYLTWPVDDTRYASTGGCFRFQGAREVDATTATDLLSLSGEYRALLKQLSKRHALVKVKALQVVHGHEKSEKE